MARYRQAPEHGTKAGYDWHKRQDKTEPCYYCRMALAQHWREQRQKRRDAINALRQQWRIAKPEAHKVTRYTMLEVIAVYGDYCYLCEEQIDTQAPRRVGLEGWERGFHIDHVIPKTKGGADTLDNIRPTHARCNMEKWTKTNG